MGIGRFTPHAEFIEPAGTAWASLRVDLEAELGVGGAVDLAGLDRRAAERGCDERRDRP